MRFFALLLVLLLLLFGCSHSRKPGTTAADTSSNTQQGKQPHLSRAVKDSIRLASMMPDILAYADKNKDKPAFNKQLRIWKFPYASAALLDFGHLFSPQKQHLIVRRMLWGTTIAVDVFVLDNGEFKPVCGQKLRSNTYVGYLIKDVNGDQVKDFLVHSSPPAGCCLRDAYDVYLYQPATGDFTTSFRFINPTFSPSDRMIRGIGYGQPGDVDIYKYKWDGLKVDTVEFIFPDSVKKDYHVYDHLNQARDESKGKFIAKIPKEFKKIDGYNWFRGVY